MVLYLKKYGFMTEKSEKYWKTIRVFEKFIILLRSKMAKNGETE